MALYGAIMKKSHQLICFTIFIKQFNFCMRSNFRDTIACSRPNLHSVFSTWKFWSIGRRGRLGRRLLGLWGRRRWQQRRPRPGPRRLEGRRRRKEGRRRQEEGTVGEAGPTAPLESTRRFSGHCNSDLYIYRSSQMHEWRCLKEHSIYRNLYSTYIAAGSFHTFFYICCFLLFVFTYLDTAMFSCFLLTRLLYILSVLSLLYCYLAWKCFKPTLASLIRDFG